MSPTHLGSTITTTRAAGEDNFGAARPATPRRGWALGVERSWQGGGVRPTPVAGSDSSIHDGPSLRPRREYWPWVQGRVTASSLLGPTRSARTGGGGTVPRSRIAVARRRRSSNRTRSPGGRGGTVRQRGWFGLFQDRVDQSASEADAGAGQRAFGTNDAGQGESSSATSVASLGPGHRLAGVEVDQPSLWRSSTTTLHRPRSWWAMPWACSRPTWRQSSTSNSSSICSGTGRPATSGDVLLYQQAGAVAVGRARTTLGTRHPAALAAESVGLRSTCSDGTKAARVDRHPPGQPPPDPGGEIPVRRSRGMNLTNSRSRRWWWPGNRAERGDQDDPAPPPITAGHRVGRHDGRGRLMGSRPEHPRPGARPRQQRSRTAAPQSHPTASARRHTSGQTHRRGQRPGDRRARRLRYGLATRPAPRPPGMARDEAEPVAAGPWG